ncbi:hypothetical protein E3O23_00270 [Cryobacterium tagatosivorans]|uniref:YgjV family protein n=1 Tax=Cryobacterium tagatosivorans TaxID=1259199 RepID=A0A4R8UHW2_9MICO|nr:hypothetical protein E3O23_00270 [Cryobacterium tagatosivorans]
MEERVDWTWWVGQALGFVGIAVILWSHWSRHRRTTVVRNAVASVILCASYLLLGMPGTAAIPALAAVRGWVVARSDEASWARSHWWTPAFVTAIWIAYLSLNGIPTWWAAWLPILGSGLVIVALSLRDVLHVKVVMFFGVATWVTYEVAFGLWGVLGGEIIGLGLIATAFMMIVRQRRALAEVARSSVKV